ncbi:hypothetical protein TTHERM_00649160 (macronuclear) [Tetrahymena thermophila SB210]|uniref:Uncharacterized protein n=1 Tax=Tetrahymena thermophila (strain SB210) TaxID=312017 RepID=I7LZR0_TETTS|nr:hypothetical protein TTHERM_00649160 [Tetrahymena thermophila SB210]EAR84647.2 hypothetical protein TTHERM_00649160 [Tetrahymena thermophila SB210]|eukprot:XP_001032310.2 hypothetical protein TTHERM_00649160 [Tetrahymena thermophila SB210]
MLKFFATGEHFKDKIDPPRFPPCYASAGEGARIENRNYSDQFSYDFKQAAKRQHTSVDYSKQYNTINNNYSDQNKFFQSKYNKISQEKQQLTATGQTDHRQQNLEICNHQSNWKIVKERSFANQARLPSEQIRQSQVIQKQDFESQKQSQSDFMKKSQSSYLNRENLFVTKPLVRLDKDFKEQPLLRNVLTVSDDTPNWCQTVNKFYTVENFDLSKKSRFKPSLNTDIFGNKIQKYENNFLFKCIEPNSSLRFEQKKMIVADKSSVADMKKLTKEDLKRGKCKIEWNEQISKQKFDNPPPIRKIGFTQEPFIKQLERKRHPNKLALNKIGESETYTKIDKERLTQLKIGHGTPQTLNPLKY